MKSIQNRLQDIQISKDVFISDLYCVYLRDISAVVVSDLHLGFEEEMNLHGLFLPRFQLSHVEGLIDRIVERYEPETLIINGDFKQEFSRNLSQEWTDIIHFIDRYSHHLKLRFVRGNHDNFLMTILNKRNLDLPEVIETDRYYIYHGDRDRSLKKITILGHEHPSLVLRDQIGGVFKIPAFVYNNESGVIITPAMSFFSSGTDVAQSLLSDEHFTPALRNTDPDRYRVYGITDEFGLVDFGYIGDIRTDQKKGLK
ncbi:metallophosphoesterase [Oxyplasma meridianum]|uniref:Metallophosphoesterase n=1 Tax=Oxyplasma meridianum TaxID=3073602 RepID=A0AAX4NIC8_9ARCH